MNNTESKYAFLDTLGQEIKVHDEVIYILTPTELHFGKVYSMRVDIQPQIILMCHDAFQYFDASFVHNKCKRALFKNILSLNARDRWIESFGYKITKSN